MMRIWPLPILCSALACQLGPGALDDSSTTTSSEGSGTTSSDTTTESSDTTTESSDTTGDEDPGCDHEAPGAEILRCLDNTSGGLTLDQGWLYFTLGGGPNGDILERMRDDGSDHEVLSNEVGDARTLTVVDGLIYWNDFFGGRVRRMPIDGGPIEDVVSDLASPNSYVIHEGMLYVTQYATAEDLVRVSLDGGTPEVVYPALDYAGELHRHDQDLWWVTNSNNHNLANQIVRGTLSGDPVEVFLDDGEDVLSDETHLYWLAPAGTHHDIQRMLYAGGPIEDLVNVVNRPGSATLAGNYLYWRFVSIDANSHNGQIHRIHKDGGTPELLAEGQNYPKEMVVGDAYVYWTTQNAIARLALP